MEARAEQVCITVASVVAHSVSNWVAYVGSFFYTNWVGGEVRAATVDTCSYTHSRRTLSHSHTLSHADSHTYTHKHGHSFTNTNTATQRDTFKCT